MEYIYIWSSLYVLTVTVTGSATSFAINFLFSSLPRIVLSPIAGYAADKYPKKGIIVLSQFVSVISVTGLLIASLLDHLSIWFIYITTGLLSISSLFNTVTFTSSIMNLIDESRTQRAFALSEASTNFGSIIGPIIGGILYATFTLNAFILVFIHPISEFFSNLLLTYFRSIQTIIPLKIYNLGIICKIIP